MITEGKYTILACFAMALLIGFISAKHQRHYGGSQYPDHRFNGLKKLPYTKIVYVSNSKSGIANFSTIQSAIDSVPQNNQEWICIYIKAGVYRDFYAETHAETLTVAVDPNVRVPLLQEQVSIPSNKPYIYLMGEGRKTTHVVWDAHDSIASSPTFRTDADNIVVKSITFQNSYNNPPTGSNPIRTAVAAYVSGDKVAFYRCRFLGFQDTLWDDSGRHYFKLCTIQGAVDFIFGSGQSLYESCTISVLAGALNGAGYITAQGRTSTNETNGFVFKECTIVGTGVTYLGRPWRPYATVIFYNSSLSEVVHPEGWNPWGDQAGDEDKLTYAEDNCYGKGANVSQRVHWEAKLSEDLLKWYTSMSYIDTEGWIRKQPFYILP